MHKSSHGQLQPHSSTSRRGGTGRRRQCLSEWHTEETIDRPRPFTPQIVRPPAAAVIRTLLYVQRYGDKQ